MNPMRSLVRLSPPLLMCASAALLLPHAVSAEPGLTALTVQSAAGGGQTYSLTLQVLLLMTAVSLLPALLLMMTSFTRIVIVLGILRQALGAGQTPPNQVIVGLSSSTTAPAAATPRSSAAVPAMSGCRFARRLRRSARSKRLDRVRRKRHGVAAVPQTRTSAAAGTDVPGSALDSFAPRLLSSSDWKDGRCVGSAGVALVDTDSASICSVLIRPARHREAIDWIRHAAIRRAPSRPGATSAITLSVEPKPPRCYAGV